MQDSPDAQYIIIANALPEVNGQTTEKKRAQEKKTGNFSSHRRGATDGTVYPSATRVFNWGAIFIATSKIAVTLDNCSKKWYNMSHGDEKNGQNAAQCGVESSC